MSPPPLPPPLPAVFCPPAISPLWRGPTSKLMLDPLQYPGARRLSHLRVSTLSLKSTCSSSLPKPAALGRPYVGPRRFCPPSLGRLVGREGGACTPQGTWCATSGGGYVGNPEPCNGLSCAWVPRRRHFQRDGNLSPECIPSGNAPPSPPGSCSTSSRPGTMSADTGGSVPAYLPVPLSPLLP